MPKKTGLAGAVGGGKEEKKDVAHTGARNPEEVQVQTYAAKARGPSTSRESSLQPHPHPETEPLSFFSGNPFVEKTEGILHLYKRNEQTKLGGDGERSQMLCMLAIPATLTTQDLLHFLEPVSQTLETMRIIRTSDTHQYMMLMKFRDQSSADAFYGSYNGVAFNGLEPGLCHLVYVAAVETVGEGEAGRVEGATELPTCAVCLERMEESVDGILTILCNHAFHAQCLRQWGDTSCPVCRCVQSGSGDLAESSSDTESEKEETLDLGLWRKTRRCLGSQRAGPYDVEERTAWSHGGQYVHAILSFSLGAYHVIGFPSLVASLGGSAFLVAYIVCLAVMSFPVLVLELSLGQLFASCTSTAFRRMCPAATGIGWAGLVLTLPTLLFVVPVITAHASLHLTTSYMPCRQVPKAMWENPAKDPRFCLDTSQWLHCLNQNASNRYYGRCVTGGNGLREVLSNDNLPTCLLNTTRHFNHEVGSFQTKLRHVIPYTPQCAVSFHIKGPLLSQSNWYTAYQDLVHNASEQSFIFENAEHDCSWHLHPRTREAPEKLAKGDYMIHLSPDFILAQILPPAVVAARLSRFLRHRYPSDANQSSTSTFAGEMERKLKRFFADICQIPEGRLDASGDKEASECMNTITKLQRVLPANARLRDEEGAWERILAMFLVWLLATLPALVGPRLLSLTVVVTVYVPIMVLLTTVSWASTLDGFMEGVILGFKPEWCRLEEYLTWLSAAGCGSLMLGLGNSVHIVLASYASPRHDTVAVAFIVCLSSVGLGVLSCVSQFGMRGVLADILDLPIPLFYSGLMVESASAMEELERIHSTGGILHVLYSLAIFALSMGSKWGCVEAVTCHVMEHTNLFSKRRMWDRFIIAAVCTLVFFVPSTAIVATHVDSEQTHVLQFMSVGLSSVTIFLTTTVIVYVYGVSHYSEALGQMFREGKGWSCSHAVWSHKGLKYGFYAAWTVFIPVGIIGIVVSTRTGRGSAVVAEIWSYSFGSALMAVLGVVYAAALLLPLGKALLRLRSRHLPLVSLVRSAIRPPFSLLHSYSHPPST